MEFERAIYRVYDRCMDGLGTGSENEENAQNENTVSRNNSLKYCRFFEQLFLVSALFLFICLLVLHFSFVGSPGCLPELLSAYANEANQSSFKLAADQILSISVDRQFSPKFALEKERESTDDDYGFLGGGWERRRLRSSKAIFPRNERKMVVLNSSSPHSSSSDNSGDRNFTAREFDYEFALDYPVLALSQKIRSEHNFQTINVTMMGDTCFGSPLAQLLIPLAGTDIIVMNNVMYTVKDSGVLVTALDDYYSWSQTEIYPYHDPASWLSFKLNVLIASCISFFALSSVTALIVRILISSGVVLVFPLFWLFGVDVFSNRVIALSYPWLGIPMELMTSAGVSPIPFVIAHLCKVIVYYMLYEAAQLAFSIWFYEKNFPGQEELWLYAAFMVWEYYSMIYVRSKASIQIFPRVSLALFLVYHFYFYSYSSGFHSLALFVTFLLVMSLMLFCVRKFELPAYWSGEVSMEQPRALFVHLPWPSWSVILAADDTLFMPPNRYSTSIYLANVPVAGPTVESAGADANSSSSSSSASASAASTSTSFDSSGMSGNARGAGGGGRILSGEATLDGGARIQSLSDSRRIERADDDEGKRSSHGRELEMISAHGEPVNTDDGSNSISSSNPVSRLLESMNSMMMISAVNRRGGNASGNTVSTPAGSGNSSYSFLEQHP